MRPLESQVDTHFAQALRCAYHRHGRLVHLPPTPQILGLGLRYGVMGVAVVKYLLTESEWGGQEDPLEELPTWGRAVSRFLQLYPAPSIPSMTLTTYSDEVGHIAQLQILMALPHLQRRKSLETCLAEVVTEFESEHRRSIRQGWGWFRAGQGERTFRSLAEESQKYALNFYERRRFSLEEVPEIALLGE